MATYEDNLATLKEQIENVTSAVEEAAEVEAVTLAEVPALVLQIKEDADSNVGKCFYTAICFKRSSTIPTTPEGGTWKKVLNDFQFTPPEGWTLSIAPAEDDQDQFVPIWMSTAIFDSSKETLVSSWTAPVRISGLSGTAGSNGKDGVDGTNGTNGTDGDAVYRTVVYKRSSEEPSRPGNSEGNYNNPCPAGWSLSIPAGTDDLWSTSRTFTKSGSGLQDVSWAAVAKIGSIGKTGCIVYPAGVYSADSTYGVNNNSVPYVAYTSNSNTNYYYLNPEVTDPSPKTRSVPGSSSDWIKMNYFNSVVTDLIVANQGTVGGFMFINEDECSYMISVLGTYYDSSGLSEQTTVTECISSYSGCTLDVTWSLSGEELTNVFQPYMSISTDGTILCNNAKLTGVINATSGSIGDLKIQNGSLVAKQVEDIVDQYYESITSLKKEGLAIKDYQREGTIDNITSSNLQERIINPYSLVCSREKVIKDTSTGNTTTFSLKSYEYPCGESFYGVPRKNIDEETNISIDFEQSPIWEIRSYNRNSDLTITVPLLKFNYHWSYYNGAKIILNRIDNPGVSTPGKWYLNFVNNIGKVHIASNCGLTKESDGTYSFEGDFVVLTIDRYCFFDETVPSSVADYYIH